MPPLTPAVVVDARSATQTRQALTSTRRILIVGHDPVASAALSDTLAGQGYQAESASTITDAIDALPDMAGRAGRRGLRVASEADGEAELARLDALSAEYEERIAAWDGVRGQIDALNEALQSGGPPRLTPRP